MLQYHCNHPSKKCLVCCNIIATLTNKNPHKYETKNSRPAR